MKKPYNTMTLVGVRLMLTTLAGLLPSMSDDEKELRAFLAEFRVALDAVATGKPVHELWDQAVATLDGPKRYGLEKALRLLSGEAADE